MLNIILSYSEITKESHKFPNVVQFIHYRVKKINKYVI